MSDDALDDAEELDNDDDEEADPVDPVIIVFNFDGLDYQVANYFLAKLRHLCEAYGVDHRRLSDEPNEEGS